MNRILLNLIIFLSIFFLNWYSIIFLLVIGVFLFRTFYEGFFYATLFDLIYKGDGYFLYTIAMFILIFFAMESLKKHLRLYPDNV